MAQKSKSRVTAPRSYDPGKGRPKEYLAYLNYQEMQALKRLNGNNQERGPKGLPSFPPAGAMSGTSAKSPASTSTAKAAGSAPKTSTASKATTAKAPTSNKMGSTSTQSGGPKSSASNVGGSKGGTGAGNNIGGAQPGRKGPAASMAAAKDSAAKQAAANKGTVQAQKNPGFKADASKPSIGKGIGGNVLRDGTSGIAGKVRGAIRNVQNQAQDAARQRSGVAALNRTIVGPSNQAVVKGFTTSFGDRANSVNALRDTVQALGSFDNPRTRDANKMIRHLAGEVGPTGVGAGQVAQVMINRGLTDAAAKLNKLPRYGETLDNPDQWQTGKTKPDGYKLAKPGSAVQAAVAEQALRELMGEGVGVPKPNATSFRAAVQQGNVKTKMKGANVAGNVFGNFDNISASDVADIRGAVNASREAATVNPTGFGGLPSVTTADLSAPNAPRPRARPESQNMQRPLQKSDVAALFGGPKTEPAAAALMRTEKLYNDRVPSEPSRAMTTQQVERQYASMGDPTQRPAPYGGPKLATKQFQDRAPAEMTTRQVEQQYARMGDPTQRPAPYAGPKLAPKQFQDRVNVLPSNEQSQYPGRPTTVPKPDQSLYTGPTARRTAEQPPSAGAERVLSVENLMSDAGIRKTVNPQPKPPAGAGMSFNGLNVPAAGMSFNPSLARMTKPVSNEQSLYNGRMTGGMSFTGVPGTSIPAPGAAPPRSGLDNPTASFPSSPVRSPQPGEDVLAAAPGAPKPGTKKETTYTLDPKFIKDEQAKVELPQVLKDPDSIFKVAEKGRWSARKDKEALTAVRDGIKELKDMGAKVNKDGTITIPAGAEKKAQQVFNSLAKAYDFKANRFTAKGIADDFSDGLGKLATEGTVNKSVPVTKDQIAQYNKDVRSYLDKAQAEGKMTRPVPSANAFTPDITRQTPDAATGWGGPLSGIQAPKAPQTAMPQTKQIYDRVPQEYKNVSPADALSRPYDVRLGEMKVSVPTEGSSGEAVNEVSTIDNYVNLVPGLDDTQRADLRRSLIADAAAGNLDFTTEDMKRKIAEVKAGNNYPVTDSEAADPAFANSLIGDDAYNAAKETGYFPPNVLRNKEFLDDPTRLGIMDQPVDTPLDPTDMAKVHARSFAENLFPKKYDDNSFEKYLTGPEKTRSGVTGAIERFAPLRPLRETFKWLANVEPVKDFLARPLYEQKALYRYKNPRNPYKSDESGFPQGAPDDGFSGPSGGPSGGGGGIGDSKGSSGIYGISGSYGGYGGGGGGGDDEDGEGGKSSSSESKGPRPQIYFEWDLGINIPSPGDSDYTMYMSYLAEREAAAAALYT